MKDLALIILEYYKSNGLWGATPITNNKGEIVEYKIAKNKLSNTQYDEARKTTIVLNEFGFAQAEWTERQEKAEKWAREEIRKMKSEPKL